MRAKRIHLASVPQNWVRITTFCKVVNAFGKLMCKRWNLARKVVKSSLHNENGAKKNWLRKWSIAKVLLKHLRKFSYGDVEHGHYCLYGELPSHEKFRNLFKFAFVFLRKFSSTRNHRSHVKKLSKWEVVYILFVVVGIAQWVSVPRFYENE